MRHSPDHWGSWYSVLILGDVPVELWLIKKGSSQAGRRGQTVDVFCSCQQLSVSGWWGSWPCNQPTGLSSSLQWDQPDHKRSGYGRTYLGNLLHSSVPGAFSSTQSQHPCLVLSGGPNYLGFSQSYLLAHRSGHFPLPNWNWLWRMLLLAPGGLQGGQQALMWQLVPCTEDSTTGEAEARLPWLLTPIGPIIPRYLLSLEGQPEAAGRHAWVSISDPQQCHSVDHLKGVQSRWL